MPLNRGTWGVQGVTKPWLFSHGSPHPQTGQETTAIVSNTQEFEARKKTKDQAKDMGVEGIFQEGGPRRAPGEAPPTQL